MGEQATGWPACGLVLRITAIVVALPWLSACVESAAPILTDSQPLLGQRPRLQFYSLQDGRAREPQTATFRWTGSQYVVVGRGIGINAFTLHPFRGDDWIAQSRTSGSTKVFEYAVVRKLADGVRLAVVIDEDDADGMTRGFACENQSKFSCRISNRDQLFTFAYASAAKMHKSGALIIELGQR